MNVPIHLVCREMPFPAENDAEMDVIAIAEELVQLGHQITLHYFSGNKRKTKIPEGLFVAIHAYDTRAGYSILKGTPREIFIRSNQELSERLHCDNHPILFHGLHSTHVLFEKSLGPRSTILRLTRDDAAYYESLSAIVNSRWDSLKYWLEKSRIHPFLKKILQKVDFVLTPKTIAENIPFIKNSSKTTIVELRVRKKTPEFHEGMGGFCLYHGKLAKRENEFAALWLLENVFNKLEIPFVIAGSGASEQLENAAHLRMHTCLVNNPSEGELQDLIRKSQVVLLPAFSDAVQHYPVELSISLGRHILINPKGLKHHEIGKGCHIAENPESFIEQVETLFREPFTKEMWSTRNDSLSQQSPLAEPGLKISQLIAPHYQ